MTDIKKVAVEFMEANKQLMQDLALQERIEEIRGYKLADIAGSAGSIKKDIAFLLAQIDALRVERGMLIDALEDILNGMTPYNDVERAMFTTARGLLGIKEGE